MTPQQLQSLRGYIEDRLDDPVYKHMGHSVRSIDGVIADATAGYSSASRAAANRLGYPVPPEITDDQKRELRRAMLMRHGLWSGHFALAEAAAAQQIRPPRGYTS